MRSEISQRQTPHDLTYKTKCTDTMDPLVVARDGWGMRKTGKGSQRAQAADYSLCLIQTSWCLVQHGTCS